MAGPLANRSGSPGSLGFPDFLGFLGFPGLLGLLDFPGFLYFGLRSPTSFAAWRDIIDPRSELLGPWPQPKLSLSHGAKRTEGKAGLT